MLAPTFFLFISNFLFTTSNPIYAFAADPTPLFFFLPSSLPQTPTSRGVVSISVNSDFQPNSRGFNSYIEPNNPDTFSLFNTSFVLLIHLSICLICVQQSLLFFSVYPLAFHCPGPPSCLSLLPMMRTKLLPFFTLAHLLCKTQIHLTHEYCNLFWHDASFTRLSIIGRAQRRSIRVIENFSLKCAFWSPVKCRGCFAIPFLPTISWFSFFGAGISSSTLSTYSPLMSYTYS